MVCLGLKKHRFRRSCFFQRHRLWLNPWFFWRSCAKTCALSLLLALLPANLAVDGAFAVWRKYYLCRFSAHRTNSVIQHCLLSLLSAILIPALLRRLLNKSCGHSLTLGAQRSLGLWTGRHACPFCHNTLHI